MTLIDHRNVKRRDGATIDGHPLAPPRTLTPGGPGRVAATSEIPRASDGPRASRSGSSRTTEQLPTTQHAVGRELDEPALEHDETPGYGWTLFVGAIIGLAVVKTILGRIGENPVTVGARSVSALRRLCRPLCYPTCSSVSAPACSGSGRTAVDKTCVQARPL